MSESGEPAIDPCIGVALAVLDAAVVPWLHLRGSLDGTAGDVDLLVAATSIERLDGLLGPAGFRRLPAIGYGSHRFWLAWEPARGGWRKLDVVTELAYGPGGTYRAAGAEGCLGRRERASGRWRPAPDDAFWTLALHVLLDRDGPSPEQTIDLAERAAGARLDGELGTWVERTTGRGTARRIVAACRDEDASRLRHVGRRLALAAWSRDTAGVVPRWVVAQARRFTARLFVAARRPGLIVALLGPDGAGKSTLAAGLQDSFPIPGRQLYLGLYGKGSSTPHGLGLPIRSMRMVRARLIAAWHVRRGRIVVLDRHPLDFIASRRRGTRARLRHQVLVALAPTPGLILVLDAPPKTLLARKGEHDLAHLKAARKAYSDLAKSNRSAILIDASADAAVVRRTAIGHIWDRLSRDWSRRGTDRG